MRVGRDHQHRTRTSPPPFNAAGAALWVAVWTSVGCFSGDQIDTIYRDGTRYDTYFAVAFGVVVLAWARRLLRRRVGQRRARLRSAAGPGPGLR